MMGTKFGWMEIMDLLLWLKHNHDAAVSGMVGGIIPTVLIPLTALTVALTSLAGIIAGWFGIKLHTEGPKQLLEVLLKTKVIVSAVILNLLIIAGIKGYRYYQNAPRFISTIEKQSEINAKTSPLYYENSGGRPYLYTGAIVTPHLENLKHVKETSVAAGAFRSGLISGESLFYGTDNGFIYEFNKNNLELLRKFYIGNMVTTRPIIFEGRIYAGEGSHDTHHARVYSFDLKTGKFINSFSTKGHTEGQPVIASDGNKTLLFIVAGKDGLYAVDPITMKEIWHNNDGHLDASISYEAGVVYTGTGIEKENGFGSKYATAYDFTTGKKIWQTELPLSNWMHPAVTNQNVCYSLGEIYSPSKMGFVHCLDKKTGQPQFTIPFDSPLTSKPFLVQDHLSKNEYLFVSEMGGKVCGLNLTTKEKMWCHETSSHKKTSSFSSFNYDQKRGVVWYLSHDQGLYAFNPLDGKIVHHEKNLEGTFYGAVTIDMDFLYFMNIEGKLKQVELM